MIMVMTMIIKMIIKMIMILIMVMVMVMSKFHFAPRSANRRVLAMTQEGPYNDI